ncbi:MAG: hypothetical protein HDQ97_00775 [Lachnospiraceae bacterium]|nr:hypothetical protein [Lachnospiraceae bacterium]
MGILAFVLIIGLCVIIGLVFTIIGMFVGHIILFDSILISIVSGILSNRLLHIHPAFCFLLSIILFILLFRLQYTKVGFWIISVILSGFWGFVFCVIAYAMTNGDMVWTYVVLGVGFVFMMLLHLKSKNNNEG